MGTKHTSTCLKNAADDEPIFVLRAQDKFAATVVRIWAEIVSSHGDLNVGALDKALSARNTANEMDEWHTHKSPD